ATVMHPFGSIIRSIIVAIYEFNIEDVIVVGHHGCGMSNLDTRSIMDKIVARGISHETISTLYNSGINIEKWLHGFESVDAAIKESVHAIKKHPLVPHNVNIHGLIIDPHTGSLEVVVNGY
ncbi:MAG: carbonic anhydrase, partial [Cellulosilyticaceae bacterium]